MKQIPITKPLIGKEEKAAIIKPLESGWLVQGANVQKFEKMFAQFTGAKAARATTSCTTALHLALESLGIGKGDKVIVPAFTYVASANAVEYTGAKVIFCDVDLNTFNIDVAQLEDILKKRPAGLKAIMPVSLFGLCADFKKIIPLAKKYRLKVIEDSACGLGAYIGKKHSGIFGDAGCFSFHPRKSITTGEGGMLITKNKALVEKATQLRDHGASISDFTRHFKNGGSLLPEFNVRGFNYRMTDLQGALGVAQMKKVKAILNGRAKIAKQYNKTLKTIDELQIPYVPNSYTHGYQSYVCLFTNGEQISKLTMRQIARLNKKRNHFMAKLAEYGISTRQGTHAVHTLGYYKNKYHCSAQKYLNSFAADQLSVTLPLYANMTTAEFNYVVSHIKTTLKRI